MDEGQQLWAASAPAWIAQMRRGDVNRTLLLDAPMLELAGAVAGRRVLDLGCGEGRFCRMLAERGAGVIGVDPTTALLGEARQSGGQPAFLRASGEDLPFPNGTFDLVVAYLVLIDIPDFRRAISEVARVLRPGGRVIAANLNPFATTRERAWVKDADGRRLYVAVDNYFDERAIRLSWAGIEILNWHRPMEAYMEAFLDAGLRLTHFAEPRPAADSLGVCPDMVYNLRVPLFHTMVWTKP